MATSNPFTALKGLFRRTATGGPGRKGGRRRSTRHALGGEQLENRLLLALSTTRTRSPSDGGSVRLHSNGTLYINATDRNDNIYLHNHWPYLYVHVDNDRGLQYAGHWHVHHFQRVEVDAGRGGDLIDARNCFAPTKVWGSFGSDLMYAGASTDVFIGGAQEDLFIANDNTWPQMAGHAADTFDGGDDADGVILSHHTHVHTSRVESRFGGNLPWRPTGWHWQRSAYGKWELPLIDTSNGQHPLSALVPLNYEIKAELRADGLRLSFYADAKFFSKLFGQWGGASPFDQAIYVGATADSTGNLTWRITVPANAPLPFGDAIDAAGMLGAATVDDTITYLFRWEDGPGKLYFAVEFEINAGTRHYKGIGFKGGVDVHMGATLAIGNTRSVHSWDGFIQNFRIHAGYWAKESFTGIGVGASGTLTDQYVEIHWHNVAKFKIPFSRPAWAGSRSSTSSSMLFGGSFGLESQALASTAFESYVQPAVFVVNTKDDDLSNGYDDAIGSERMSLRRALSLAANEDSPVEIVFSERLATGVEGAVNEIYVGNPYYEFGFGARSPLVVNNTYGHAITIDASAIGGIAITGQGMQIGAAGWEEPTAPGSGTPGYDDPYGDPYGGGGNPGTSGMSRSGAVTLRGVTFRDNVGELGGAIEVLPGAVVTLDDVWLSGNEASNAGGAVYIHGRREELTGQLGDAGSVTVIGGQWTNNTAAAGNGGVFYVGPGASLRVSGEVWAMGNTASGDGGVIYSDSAGNEAGGGLVVESGYFWNNSAGGSGGAIYAREAQLGSSDSGSAEVEERIGISFMYNTAGSAGGGVALIADASSSVLGAHIAHNTAAVGGGIYVSGPTGFDIPRQVSIEAAVNGNRATGGEGLVARGGGIFVGGGVEVPLMGSWVYANTVGGDPSADDYTGPTGEGGGVYVADGGVLTLLEGAEIGVPAPDGEGDRADVDGNSAERGGGIYFATGSTGSFGRVLVSGNTATDAGGGLFIASGSSLSFSFDREFAALTATTISDNSAALGGGMYLAAGGPRTWALTDSGVWDWVDGLVLSGAVIADNTATTGGGIHAVGGVPAQTIALFDTTLSGNSATGDGGGIWLGTGVQGSVTTSTLAANVAAGAGGGLFATSGNSLTLTAATLTDNVAGTSGGGVLLGSGGSLTATDSLFNGNTATAGAGGGIAALSGTAVTLVDTAVNTGAAGMTGGGVHATEASVSITGGQVSGNAAGSGGGLWLNGGTALLDGTTFSGNQAPTGVGGGVGADAAASLTLSSVTLRGNIATQGGGIALLDGSVADVTGGTWAGNTARQQGGGGLVFSGSSLSADGLSVDGNGLAEVDIVPATDAAAVVALLAELGITLDAEFTASEAVEAGLETATGSRVEAVARGSAAAEAGLAAGDVIIGFGGVEITTAEQLIETLGQQAAAAQPSLVFTVVRGGEEHDVEVRTPALETEVITPASGGGIAVNGGTLSLLRSAVVGNRAANGAGLWAEGDQVLVSAVSAAIAGNIAASDGGGSWFGAGVTASLLATTVAWNKAGGTGGGLAVDPQAALELMSTVVASNSAGGNVNDTGDVIESGSGTMLAVGGSLLATNAMFPASRMTFLASNTSAVAADDIAGAVAAGSSHNLVATGASGGGIADGSLGNLVGTAAEPIDALLAAFGSYGGAVATVPLLPGSPALDAGTGDLADQRGIGPVGTRDIGAFESGGFRLVAVGGGEPAAQTATAGQAFGSPLAVIVEAIAPNEPVAGGRVIFETAAGEAAVTVASSATVEADLPTPEYDLPEGESAPTPPTVDLAAIAPSEAETAVVAVVATAGEVPGSSQVIARLGDSTVVFSLTTSGASAPKVTGVFARGSAWHADYLSLPAFTTIDGADLGRQLADGADQLADASSVSWNNVNRIAVRFDQPILLPAAEALQLIAGTAGGDVVTTPTAVTLRAGGTVAEWTLPGNLRTARYRLTLAAESIRSVDGEVSLDGEWTTSSSTFSSGSGNGQAGGAFEFDFNVLVGDVNGNGSANVLDLSLLRQGLGPTTSATFRLDVNGNGSVNVLDLAAIRSGLGKATGTRLDLLPAPTRVVSQSAFALLASAPTTTAAAWAWLGAEQVLEKPVKAGQIKAALPKA